MVMSMWFEFCSLTAFCRMMRAWLSPGLEVHCRLHLARQRHRLSSVCPSGVPVGGSDRGRHRHIAAAPVEEQWPGG